MDWHYAQAGQRFGPVSLEVLQKMARNGQLGPADLLFNPTMTNWTPLAQVGEVASYLPGAGGAMGAQQPGYINYPSPHRGTLEVTDRALDMLGATKPWARFIAVIFFICAGFAVLGTFGMLIAFMTMGSRMGSTGMGPQLLVMVFYPIGAVIYFFLGFYLNRYATQIGQLLRMRHSDCLDKALEAQKSFWKLAGICTIVGILVMIIFYAILFATLMR